MAALVKFAGDDGKPPRKRVDAYGMFKLGKDTVQIANILGITEAQASRRIFIARCKAKKLAIGFEPKSERRPGRPRKSA